MQIMLVPLHRFFLLASTGTKASHILHGALSFLFAIIAMYISGTHCMQPFYHFCKVRGAPNFLFILPLFHEEGWFLCQSIPLFLLQTTIYFLLQAGRWKLSLLWL